MVASLDRSERKRPSIITITGHYLFRNFPRAQYYPNNLLNTVNAAQRLTCFGVVLLAKNKNLLQRG